MITLLAMMIASIIWEAEGGCLEAESSCMEADGTYLEAADDVLAECVVGLRWQQGGRAVHLQAGMQVCWSAGFVCSFVPPSCTPMFKLECHTHFST